MKALTISQPYASLIRDLEKWIENRHWSTNFRGLLAIHAGKGTQYITRERLVDYPTGCIVAVVTLANCFHVTSIKRNAALEWADELADGCDRSWRQLAAHKHTEGPHCLVLRDVKPIKPIPVRGAQGLWNVPESIEVELKLRGVA